MSSTNPPQLHLSLPHQSFKRSFQQFGLDVESPGTSEGPSRSVASSSASSSGSMPSSLSSSQSSMSSSDIQGNDRNKRARSEGPERSGDNDEQRATLSPADGFSPPSLSEIRPLSAATFTSDSFPPQADSPSVPTVEARNTQLAGGRPMPHGLRADLSQATYPRPYSNLLPPRLSSPVPQTRLDEDVSMHDDSRLPAIQTRTPAEVHEEAVQHVLERAQAFDRSIAPLRSDPPRDASLGSIGDVDSLRADASGTTHSESSFSSDFEPAPRLPRTGILRPTYRYGQGAAVYRQSSPPSPPPQRFSLPPRLGHQQTRTSDWLESIHRPPRAPSPPGNVEANHFGMHSAQSRLRQRIEALLDDLEQSPPLLPLPLPFGNENHEESVDQDDNEHGAWASHALQPHVPPPEDRTYRSSFEPSSVGSITDNVEPSHPSLNCSRRTDHHEDDRMAWSTTYMMDAPRTSGSTRFEPFESSHRFEAVSTSISHGQAFGNANSGTSRLSRRAPARSEYIIEEEQVLDAIPSRPHLPTLSTLLRSEADINRLNGELRFDRPHAAVGPDAGRRTSTSSERRNFFSDRPRELHRATASLSMGPSMSDVLHGPRREDGSGLRNGGLLDDGEFREMRDNLYSSLRRLNQLEPPQPSLTSHPGLSIMREMHRIPIPSTRSTASYNHFDNRRVLEPSNRMRRNLSSDPRSTEGFGPAGSAGPSSSEDAAYFASNRNRYTGGQGFNADAQPRRQDSTLDDAYRVGSRQSLPSTSRPQRLGSADILTSLLDAFPDRTLDVSSNPRPPRPPSPDLPNNHAGSELLNLIYSGRFPSSSFSAPEETDYMDAGPRSFGNPGHGVPRHDATRRGGGPFQNPLHSSQGPTGRFERAAPSLPPLRFQQTFEPVVSEEGNDARAETQTNHDLPWRRPFSARIDQPMSGGLMADARRSASSYSQSLSSRNAARQNGEPNVDTAIQRAMMLRSLQARFQPADDSHRTVPSGGRSQGFQRAMNVLRGDGLSSLRRNQFEDVFERQQQNAYAGGGPGPRENHTHWGEIRGDNDRQSGRSLFHGRRGSALFAEPPENADNAPPNRGLGSATNAHSANHQGSPSSPMEFFSRFSARPRARMRARSLRQAEDAPSGGIFSGFRFGRRRSGASFGIGDFVRDEDFDSSYESLIALAASLGDAKPRATPAHHIASLPKAHYEEWQTSESDTRCPICLDDYKPSDPVLKAEPCDHWCHKECLEQWLHSARTCPVCRSKINPRQRGASPSPIAGPSNVNRRDEDDDDSDDSSYPHPSLGRADRAGLYAAFHELRGELI